MSVAKIRFITRPRQFHGYNTGSASDGCHTTKTAKNKKEGDNTLQYIARMSM